MKLILLRIRNLQNLPLFTFVFALLSGYYWILIFRFCHPFPKSEYFGVLFLQFAFAFVPNFYNRRIGRIFTIAGALTLVRFGTFAGISYEIITLSGLFYGAICGIISREIILDLFGRREESVSATEPDIFRRLFFTNRAAEIKENIFTEINFGILFFLFALTLERFLTYFNAPFLKGFGTLETFYLPGISSKMAFSLSLNAIDGLVFPLLYFLVEERTSPFNSPPSRHWIQGLVAGFTINVIVAIAQKFYINQIFATNTNLSLNVFRNMALFRDSGSSAWIFATLIGLFFYISMKKKGEWRNSTRYTIFAFLFLIALFLGANQGKAYFFILLPTFAILILYNIIFQSKKKLVFGIIFALSVLLVIAIPILLIRLNLINRGQYTPVKMIYDIFEKMAANGFSPKLFWISIDPVRYQLNAAALEIFWKNPLFGNGLSNLIITLKDPAFRTPGSELFLDSPASFYSGILCDTGILGAVVLICWAGIHFLIRGKKYYFMFLILPFFTGYQIVHPDGAFIVIFALCGIAPVISKNRNLSVLGNLLILGISFFFIIHSLFSVNKEEYGPYFRSDKTGVYQLFAYEPLKSGAGMRYHVFKGKTAWVISKSQRMEITPFLDDSTSRIELKQKWSFLDSNRKELSAANHELKKGKVLTLILRIPEGAKILQVEELNMKNEIRFYGDTPFCINSTQFTSNNSVKSL